MSKKVAKRVTLNQILKNDKLKTTRNLSFIFGKMFYAHKIEEPEPKSFPNLVVKIVILKKHKNLECRLMK